MILLALIFSLLNLYFNRNKAKTIILINIFIFYCLLGITIFYTVFGTNPIDSVGLDYKNGVNYYDKADKLLALCEFLRFIIFYNVKKTDGLKFTITDNSLIFVGLVCLVISALVFGIKRDTPENYYKPAISTFYELGYLFFLFLEKYRGKKSIKKSIVSILVAVYILQDLAYGGRITSLQIILILFFTRLWYKQKFRKLLPYIGIIVITLALIGIYRQAYLSNINTEKLLPFLAVKLLVFDTAVFAYYGSITQLYASAIIDLSLSESIFQPLISIILGSSVNAQLFENNYYDLTIYVRDHLTHNVGGGVLFSQYYFFFGITGVVILSAIKFYTISKLTSASTHNSYFGLILIVVTATVPRWFLYNPFLFWRSIFVATVLYFILQTVDKLLKSKT